MGLAFSPDVERIAVADPGVSGRCWAIHTGARLFTLDGSTVAILDVRVQPDGSRIATAGFDHAIRLFDAAGGGRCALGTVAASTTAFSPDGSTLGRARGGSPRLL